jgi:hypothetical protein
MEEHESICSVGMAGRFGKRGEEPIVQLSSRNSTRMRNLLFLHVCRRSPKTISGVKIMIAAGMLVS